MNFMFKKLIAGIIILSSLATNLLVAEELQPVEGVKFYTQPEEIVAGEIFKLFVEFDLAEGWHIYSIEPQQFGKPLSMKIEHKNSIELSGWLKPEAEEFLQYGKYPAKGYGGNFVFSREIKTNVEEGVQELPLKLKTSWLSCGYDRCIPGKKEIALIVKLKK